MDQHVVSIHNNEYKELLWPQNIIAEDMEAQKDIKSNKLGLYK